MTQDYAGIPEELKAKLIKWEQNTPANKQVQLLSDIADISQEMLDATESERKGNNKAIEHFGSLLMDMREQLVSLNSKEAPEAPDTSQPVIDAISKLEKALAGSIKAIDTKPVVNIPQASAPVVNVDAPVVKIDNKELTKILKTDLPKAFNEAIKSIVIPENDDAETNSLLQELSQKLDSINTGVRLKPQSPTTITTLESTGLVPKVYDSITYTNTSTTVDTYRYYTGGTGGTLVATVTVTYSDPTTKSVLVSVVRT